MNAKKPRRRASKLTQKNDRGGQNRRAVEGKSNIAAKRVTLLPGFLINGFTSKTVQKTKAVENSRKKKNHLLTNDLQAYLEQKGKHLRRSQRIQKKHIEQRTAPCSQTSSSNNMCESLVPTPLPTLNNMTNNFSFKSILKNNSKSLFKDISDRFSKVNIHNTDNVSHKPNDVQENRCEELRNFEAMEEISNKMNQNLQFLSQNHFKDVLPTEPQNLFRINLNRSFCRNLESQISVTFKRNPVDECRENIRKKIDTVNIIVEGRAQAEEMIVHDSEENEARAHAKNGSASKFYPIPPQNWVYSTPTNQKIGVPHIEECQLQAGVLYNNKNLQNLYEVKQSCNVDFSSLQHIESVPIDDRFMRVAQMKKTPANSGFRRYRDEDGFQQPWREPEGCGGRADLGGQKDSFLNPNFANILTRPKKLPQNPLFTNYHEDRAPTPQVQQHTDRPFTDFQDFTFIEEGNDFKMRESQPAEPEQRNKRRLSDEEFVIKRRNVFITEPVACDKKMFNFGSQDRNIFDFGKV